MPADRSSQSVTRRRVRSVYDDQSQPCIVCGKVVSRRSDLARHMRTHEGDQVKLKCDVEGCNFKTLQKSNLNCHKRRHDQDKRYVCHDTEDCTFASCDAASLIRHRKNKHGYKPRHSAPKKVLTEDELLAKRVPAAITRSIVPTPQTLTQFSTFQALVSSPTPSSSELSDLTELTDSDSDSLCSRPSPESEESTAIYYMSAPPLTLPDDILKTASYPCDTRLASGYINEHWTWDNSALFGSSEVLFPSLTPVNDKTLFVPSNQLDKTAPGYQSTGFLENLLNDDINLDISMSSDGFDDLSLCASPKLSSASISPSADPVPSGLGFLGYPQDEYIPQESFCAIDDIPDLSVGDSAFISNDLWNNPHISESSIDIVDWNPLDPVEINMGYSSEGDFLSFCFDFDAYNNFS